ncbi:MAG: aldehyde ferredoxin oxidoreductase family protein [Acidobacteriota bacterium]
MKAQYGYIGKLLFINLSDMAIREEELSEDTARAFIGGYGIGARIIYERMKPGVDPLGPDNIFGLGTGPLTLTGTVSTSRFTTMGKSPLTGYWGDANSGGNFANALKASGYDAVFFEGKAERPVYLRINNGKAELVNASHLWGRNTVDTEGMILEENSGKDYKVICIGMAGEKRSRIAAVINDRGRAAGRSGLGGVMGSKNLKAVACYGYRRPDIFDKYKVKELVTEILEDMESNPSIMYQIMSSTGTPGGMYGLLRAHDVPIKNWGGNHETDFPKDRWPNVTWDAMEKYVTEKYACEDCRIACGGWLTVEEGKFRVEEAHKPEYETLAALGPNCLNDDMESLIYANELCNLYGLDTISAGASIAFAMECFENGILTSRDADGLELIWGNSDAIVKLIEKMGRREGLGDILAEGPRMAAEKIGRGSDQFAMHVGGEPLPMHDPRQAPGFGATYVSDPTPARHTRGGTAFAEGGMAPEPVMKLLGLPLKMEKYNPENKGACHAVLAGWMHLVNTSGACLFAADALNFRLMDLLGAITGWELDVDAIKTTGKRIATMLHAFNLREGFRPADFTLPPRVNGIPPLTAGKLKGITIDSEGLKKQYYDAMGYDFATGKIRPETIEALGLQDILS